MWTIEKNQNGACFDVFDAKVFGLLGLDKFLCRKNTAPWPLKTTLLASNFSRFQIPSHFSPFSKSASIVWRWIRYLKYTAVYSR